MPTSSEPGSGTLSGQPRRTTGGDPLAELLQKAAQTRGGPAVEALERAAELLLSRGEPEAAIWRLEEALRRADDGPTEPRVVARVCISLALLHEEHLGRIDRAVALLEQAHKLDPDQPRAIEAGRRIHRAIGDLSTVARLYEIELETAPPGSRTRRAELIIELAEVLVRIDELPAAAARLETALPLVSDPARAIALRERLANLYAAPAFSSLAPEDSAAALARAASLFRELADGHRRKGEHEEEINAYRRALGVVSTDLEAASGLEAAYRATGQDDKLVRLYRQAPWLPGAARRLAELAIGALRELAPTGSGPHRTVARQATLTAAIDALLATAADGTPIDDLLPELEDHLLRVNEHGRVAALHEQLLALSDDRDPLDRADRLVTIAKHHKQAGDLARFEGALLDALQAYPGHEEAYEVLAEHLSARRDYPTLVAVAEAALAAAPPDEHAARLEELAELYDKRLGDVAGAVETWQRRLAFGRSDRAETELKRLRVKEARWAGLVASLERELELAASSDARAEVLRRLGQVHRERHDLERARALFNDALELRPTDPSLYRTLGEIAELEGRFEDLTELLRRQYRAAKDRVEKLNLLRRIAAIYEERLGDWDGIEWACEEILTQLPSDRDALRRLEQCHELKGDEGVEALLRVLEAHAASAATPVEKTELYRKLARRYEGTGQLELAADRWERLVRIDKGDTDATLALAKAYEGLDRPADAALAYARLLDDARGRTPRSADALTESDRAEAWRSYARILDQRLADPTRATAAWQQLLGLRPADREALAALTSLHRQRGDQRALEELLARRISVADGPDAAMLALELARLQAARGGRREARARIAPLLSTMTADELAGPIGADALALTIDLADADGDARGALLALERGYFCGPEADRPRLAHAIAERWGALSPSSPATLLAWERVRELQPEDPAALEELSARYATAGLPDAQRGVDLIRLELAQRGGDRMRVVELAERLAELIEQQLADPRAAFLQLEQALGPSAAPHHGRILDGLRTIAARAGLYGELQRVLGEEPGLVALTERALLFEERLREPRRAFEVVRSGFMPDRFASLGPASTTVATLVPHLLRLGERAGDHDGVQAALCEAIPYLPAVEQAQLFVTRAEVREKRQKDPSGALDELLRAVPLLADEDPAALELDREMRRLALVTRRFEDLLGLLSYRAARAPRGSERRAALLDEAAALIEQQLRSPLRAFRMRMTTLAQLPHPLDPPTELRDELWRLARLVERAHPVLGATDEGRADKAAEPGARTQLSPLPARAPIRLTAAAIPTPAPAAAPVVIESSRPPRDPTQELAISDLVIESSRPRRDPTMELGSGDLAEVARGAPPPRPVGAATAAGWPQRPSPPPLPGVRGQRAAPPPSPPPAPRAPEVATDLDGAWLLAAPVLDQPVAPITEPHGAWDELATVLHRAERAAGRTTKRARLAVANMWEDGAGRVDRALAELRDGFLDPSAPESLRSALDELVARHGAYDELVAILDDAIPNAPSSEKAIALLLDTAAIRERQGQLDDAEARYRRILGIRPDQPKAIEQLEGYYRKIERWESLAELMERRLHGLLERLPPGPERSARAIELSEIYERIGKRFDAISTLESLVQQEPGHVGAFVALGRLYEAQAQWSKFIEILVRRIDLIEAGEGSATQPEARRLRLRIAKIYGAELQLPERALETYLALDRAGLPDPEVERALEQLYQQLGRWLPLAELYERQTHAEGRAFAERIEACRRRIAIFTERAPDPKRLAEALRELSNLSPDDGVLAELERALDTLPDTLMERIEVGTRRLQLAEATGAEPARSALLLVRLGTLEIEAGRTQEAMHTLEQAIALAPPDAEVMAQLARLREGGDDWRGYADARERQAAMVKDDRAATRALIDAAEAALAHDGDRERARVDADQALARCPDDAALIAALRAVYQQLGDAERALLLLHREIDLPAAAGARRAELLVVLAGLHLQRGATDEAGAAFHAANEADPGYAPAVHGLADLAAKSGAWDDVEPLLRYAATRTGVQPSNAAALFRRLAEAATARGNADDAYVALIEADRRQPGDSRTRLQLGRNRFAQNRFREAAQHLGVVAEHPDLHKLGPEAAQALYEGAVAELKIRRPPKADVLLAAALELDPEHELALGLASSRRLDEGDLAGAVVLLERQAEATRDATDRAARWERIATVVREELNDRPRAAIALRAAVAAWDSMGTSSSPPAGLLEALLKLEREQNLVHDAAATAARLLQYSAAPSERARRLRESAALEAALGNSAAARARLASAHDLDPADAETLGGYSALLAREGDDVTNAQLLTRTLAAMPPPSAAERPARAILWHRLAEARDRLGDPRGALAAFERVLELDPGRRALRVAVLERYGEDPAAEAQAALHRRIILDEDPLDLPSLRALERVEIRAGHGSRATVLQSLQAVAGALAVGRPIPMPKSDARAAKEAPVRTTPLGPDELAALLHPDAGVMAEVFGAIYEGIPPDELADLAALGVRPEARVTPTSGDPASDVFSECARLFDNRRAALYMKDDPSLTRAVVMVRQPTAIVLSPALASLPAAELRFHVGRAFWLLRPDQSLAIGLARGRLNSLFMSAVRAFHPRHASARGSAAVSGAAPDKDAQQLRRDLPYKIVRRLAELFQRETDTAFSSARWRRGVEHSANRSGLVACGDFRAAARVLRDEGDEDALRELARFALSDNYLALHER